MTGSTEHAIERNDFHVLQTYDELAEMIYEAVVYELAYAQEYLPPSRAEVQYAEEVARKVKGRVMLHVDAMDVPAADALTARELQVLMTAVSDVWIVQADDEVEPNEVTLLWRKLRRIAGDSREDQWCREMQEAPAEFLDSKEGPEDD